MYTLFTTDLDAARDFFEDLRIRIQNGDVIEDLSFLAYYMNAQIIKKYHIMLMKYYDVVIERNDNYELACLYIGCTAMRNGLRYRFPTVTQYRENPRIYSNPSVEKMLELSVALPCRKRRANVVV